MHNMQTFGMRRPLLYRLAAIDIDDTLVGPDKLISAPNRRAVGLLRTLGVRVVLASGRGHDNMLPFHRLLGLDDYMVSAQGALVKHSETDEVLYERPIPEAKTRQLIDEGAALGVTVLCFGHHGVYVQRLDRWTAVYREDSNAGPLHVVDLTAGFPERTALKVIWAADPERIDTLALEAAAQYQGRLGTCITNPYYLEFNHPEANKAAGVGALANRYGIMPEQVMAFGDGNNDVQMLAWAGLGIAMHYGRASAKAVARQVSPPGDPETALARAVAAVIGRDYESEVA
jgi:Cof subfamily protein (haloacid dehalogenase superfamily)